jgi:hypothetical protein
MEKMGRWMLFHHDVGLCLEREKRVAFARRELSSFLGFYKGFNETASTSDSTSTSNSTTSTTGSIGSTVLVLYGL